MTGGQTQMTVGELRAGMSGLLPGDDHVFGLIAQGALPDGEHADSVARLVAEEYVVLDALRGNRPVALDPDDVARRKMLRMLEENAARIAEMSELPAVAGQLGEQFRRSQWRAGAGSEFVDDVSVVNQRLDDLVGSAEWEILAAQPAGPRTELQLNRSVERDTAALGRGVAKRTLYLDTVRSAKATAEYARTMSGLGAEFRTLVSPFERCIVVDRSTAIVSNHLVEGAPEHSAWIISDRAFVAYVVAEYEEKWRRADRWAGELRGRGREVDTVSAASQGVWTTPRQREIMRDQCEGITQAVTARRLGVSTRTVATDIDDLKSLFQADSLMQLAIKWWQSPDRLIDDTVDTADTGEDGDGGTAAA